MLCWTWAMYFSAAASSENDQGSMNLASNTASVPSTIPSRVAAIQGIAECLTWRCTSRDLPAGIALVPGAIELLGRNSELHDQIAGEVLKGSLAPFLPPESDEGRLIAAHDNSGVRAADKEASILHGDPPFPITPYSKPPCINVNTPSIDS